jgi:hypothetical protein
MSDESPDVPTEDVPPTTVDESVQATDEPQPVAEESAPAEPKEDDQGIDMSNVKEELLAVEKAEPAHTEEEAPPVEAPSEEAPSEEAPPTEEASTEAAAPTEVADE